MTKKIVRWLYKTIYRNTHNKYYSHNKNLWPYFKFKKNKELLFFKGEEIKLYKNNHKVVQDKPLTLVLTGPSINTTDSSYFNANNYDLLGTNGAISISSNFKYYCIIDEGFVDKRRDLVRGIISNHHLVLFCSVSVITRLLDIFRVSDIKCYIKILNIVIDGVCFPFLERQFMIDKNTHPDFFNQDGCIGFSPNANFCVFDYYTVAYVSLQVAYFLGYKEIYLAGLDMNNFDKPRFYESLNNKQPTNLLYHMNEIIDCFNYASVFCQDNNIFTFNLSHSSSITSFPFK